MIISKFSTSCKLKTEKKLWVKLVLYYCTTALPLQPSSDLSDVCGCCGAGGFRGDGLSTEQHARVQVTVSVDLLGKDKTLHLLYTSHWLNLTLEEWRLMTIVEGGNYGC